MYGSVDAVQMSRIITEAGFTPRSYSGRAMYGRQCLGFVPEQHESGDEPSPLAAVAMLMLAATDDEEREDLAEAIRGCARDSTGRDTMLYFPRLEWTADIQEQD